MDHIKFILAEGREGLPGYSPSPKHPKTEIRKKDFVDRII
jgi:hypothetical protein